LTNYTYVDPTYIFDWYRVYRQLRSQGFLNYTYVDPT